MPLLYYIFKFLRVWSFFAGITLLFSLLLCFSSFNIFKMSGKNSKLSFVPGLNLLILLDIVKMPKYAYILFLIPVVNVLIIYYVLYRISIIYNTNKLFACGLILLPVFFLPALNYSKNLTMNEDTKITDPNLLTEEEITSLNNCESERQVDNVFKSNIKIEEKAPLFKARTIKYREMMLSDIEKDKIEEIKPEVIEKKEIKKEISDENDSIEIIEL